MQCVRLAAGKRESLAQGQSRICLKFPVNPRLPLAVFAALPHLQFSVTCGGLISCQRQSLRAGSLLFERSNSNSLNFKCMTLYWAALNYVSELARLPKCLISFIKMYEERNTRSSVEVLASRNNRWPQREILTQRTLLQLSLGQLGCLGFWGKSRSLTASWDPSLC